MNTRMDHCDLSQYSYENVTVSKFVSLNQELKNGEIKNTVYGMEGWVHRKW